MHNYDFVIVTENKPMVSWLSETLRSRGFSVLVSDLSGINPKSINVLFYYSKIVSSSFLAEFSDTVILNVHNSLLPDYRGLHAFSWAIEFGESELGYSLHKVSAEVDAGQLVAQTRFSLPATCDVNCAFRIGLKALKQWLPVTLERLIHEELLILPKVAVPKDNCRKLFKRRSGPYVLTDDFDMARLKNALRASNPPYGQGLVFHRDKNPHKIYLLPFSPECWEWVGAQEFNLMPEVVQCSDGYLEVNSIVMESAP